MKQGLPLDQWIDRSRTILCKCRLTGLGFLTFNQVDAGSNPVTCTNFEINVFLSIVYSWDNEIGATRFPVSVSPLSIQFHALSGLELTLPYTLV